MTTRKVLWNELTPEMRAFHGLKKCSYCNNGYHDCRLKPGVGGYCDMNGTVCKVCDGRGFWFGDNS